MDSPIGQQAYAEIKHYQLHGPPMALSIGYQTRKDRWKALMKWTRPYAERL
jgi:hypothetical protein